MNTIACISTPFLCTANQHSLPWVCHIFFSHSSSDGAIMSNEDMNTHAGAFAWPRRISLEYTTRRAAEWHGSSMLNVLRNLQTTVFQVTLPFYIPTSSARGEDNWRETTERKPFAGCLCRNSSTSSADGKLCRWQHASQQRWQSFPFRRYRLWGISLLFSPLPYTQA